MLFVLRVLHIVLGTFWAGTIIFMAAFLAPSARAVGPAAGPMMGQLMQVRKLTPWLIASGCVTVLAGAMLLWHASGGFQPEWMGSPMGIGYSTGGLLAILGLLLGVTQNAPTAQKIAAFTARRAAATTPPTPEDVAELQRLNAKMGLLGKLGAGLLAGATFFMAIARYLG